MPFGVLGQQTGGTKLSKRMSMLCIYCDCELFLVILLHGYRKEGISCISNYIVDTGDCESVLINTLQSGSMAALSRLHNPVS